jgi:putative sterol carrier protein
VPKGQAGIGFSLYSKADCIIKLSEEDLFDLLTDNLKPFTAYMNGRIEIDGDLQDVFKLKKLIKSVTAVLPKK